MEKILPNALRLATLLESSGEGCTCHAWAAFECGCGAPWPEQYCKEAAKELRRLQEEVEFLNHMLEKEE